MEPEPGVAIGVPAGSAAPASWAGRTFAALRHRDYRLFFIGMAVSSVGTWGRFAAQQWLVSGLTTSERWLAWTSAASLLTAAIVAGPAGTLVDRVDKRRLLLRVQFGSMALSATLAVLVWTGVVTPLHVVLVAAAMGVMTGIEMPCRQAYMIDLVGRDSLRNAIALNSVMFNLPLIVGPALAALLIETTGMASVFVVDALSYVATIVAFSRIRARGAPASREAAHPLDQLLAGVRYVRRDRAVRAILLLLAAAMFFGWSYGSLLAAYAREALHHGTRGYGLLYLSSGFGACAGALWVAGRRTVAPMRMLVGCAAVFALSLIAMGQSGDPVVAVASRTVAGFAMIAFFATGNSTIQLSVPDAIRGRVMALWTATFGLSLPLGQLFLGEVARRTSVASAYSLGGVLVLVATAVVLATAGRAARRPAPDRG